jgi:integrase
MATFRKRNDRWQVQVRRIGGFQSTRSFASRDAAERWARETENRADRWGIDYDPGALRKLSFPDILNRYAKEVVPTKKGARRDGQSVRLFLGYQPFRCQLAELTPQLFARYRDHRLSKVKPSTVRRELAVLQSILNVAQREWGIAMQANPLTQIRKPPPGRSRIRRLSEAERHALEAALGATENPRTQAAIRFALATGLRRGELLRIRRGDLNLDARTLEIPETKTGYARLIPLSTAAIEAIADLVKQAEPNELVFGLTENALNLAWGRLRRRAGLADFRFHDLRHDAISRFFERGLTMPEVAAISGHRDPRMLFRYAHADIQRIARKLTAERVDGSESA